MKKMISLLLCLLLMMACFSGCGKDEPKTITLVTENNFFDTDGIIEVVELLYPDIQLNVVTLPVESMERETALQNMRTEIMAGKGPDVFLLSSWNVAETTWDSKRINVEYPRVDPLFESVDDAMNNGTFLVLDDYLADSKYFGHDKQPQIIMDAGKSEFGQVVLPLYYSVPMFLADKSLLKNPETDLDSLDDLLATDDLDLLFTNTINMDMDFPSFFTHYENEDNNLTLTEEEFTEAFMYAKGFYDAEISCNEKEQWNMIHYDPEGFFYSGLCEEDLFIQWTYHPDEVLPVVTHNIDDGVTAFVEVFGAVNGATEYPDEAFKVLEIFYSDEIQTSVGFVAGKTDNGTKIRKGIASTHIGAFGKSRGISACSIAMTEVNLIDKGNVDYINSMITNVRFVTEFDCILSDAYREMREDYVFNSKRDEIPYEDRVKALYDDLNPKLKMVAAE